MNKTNKILMISYSFPPIKGIGTLRNYNMADQLKNHFKVKILSTKNRFILPIENIKVDHFDISYLKTFDYKTIVGKNYLKTNVNRRSNKIGLKNNKESKRVIFMRKLINSFPFNLFFGEGGLIYILHGLYLSRKYYKKGYQTIYSSFRPISDHYIAYINKIFNKELIWVADYRDLPFYNELNKTFLLPKLQMLILKKIIKKADYVITISEGLKSFFKKYNENVIVLRNGTSGFIEKECLKFKIEKFTISYTGSLYDGKRNPSMLFKSIKNLIEKKRIMLKDINLVYAGNEGEVWRNISNEYDLEAAVTDHGMIPIQRSIALQSASHINLLLSWSSLKQKGILTGKFYEYINAKKDILVLIDGVQDKEFEDIIEELNIGYVAYDSVTDIEEYIFEKYHEWKLTGDIKLSINNSMLKKYSWDNQFNNFMEKFNNT